MTPVDGIYVLAVVFALALLFLAWWYVGWAENIAERKTQRMVRRNLDRTIGRWTT